MDNYSGTDNLSEGDQRGRSSSNLMLCGSATEQQRVMLVSSTSPGMTRCRAASEMEVEVEDYRSGRIGGPTKIGRTDGYAPFVCREQKMQIQMDSGSGSDHHLPVLRNRSGSDNSSACLVSEGRPRLAPSYASSERSMFNHDGSSSTTTTVSSDSRLLFRSCNDPVLSPTTTTTTDARRAFYTPPPPPAGMPVSSMAMDTGVGMHGVRTGGGGGGGGVRPPFSPAQWQELEHQALIFKYMMASVPVPPELIIPIRKSLLSLPQRSPPPLQPHHHHHQFPTLAPWSSFHMGFAGNMDPEPGRCRRTDGKKWRCSRDVVPDQKYCERHMHRGRHRSRKPVEGHTAAVTSQSNSSSASAPSSLSLAATTVTSSTNVVLVRPSIPPVNSLQKHQPGPPLLGTKNLSFTGSGSQIQQYPLQSPAGAVTASSPSAMGNKDYRYENGMKVGEMDEHILFSETSGGSSTINNQWRFMAAPKAAVPHIPQSKTNSAHESLMQYSSSPQLRTLLGQGQNLGIVSEGNQVASIHMNPHEKQQQQRQQHSFLSTDYGRVQEAMREPEEQPLRHFFDEWPRSRNPWATDVEDEASNRSCSTTQLSISIPSNFSATNTNSSPGGKLSLTSLKLSMSGDASDPVGVDPIEMGLAVGMNMNVAEEHHRQTHQANWVPTAWGNPMGIGGPLAEVLQSSTTPSGCSNNSKGGRNLMNDIGWKDTMNNSSSSNKNSTASSHSRDSPPSCMQTSSPTERGVSGRMGSAIDHPVPPHEGIRR